MSINRMRSLHFGNNVNVTHIVIKIIHFNKTELQLECSNSAEITLFDFLFWNTMLVTL